MKKNPWPRRIAGAAVIILLTMLAYLPAMPGKFIWDDDSWTTGISDLLRNFAGLRAMWFQPSALQQYYPLAGASFWMDYHLWGFWTLPYHVENVILHIVSALLFWRLLRRLNVPGAWLAAAIFAVHPIMVESVAWITERKNVLSLVFYLSGLLIYGRFTSNWNEEEEATPPREVSDRQKWTAYAIAFVLFSAALLAKATAFSFPAVILLICWWKRGRIRLLEDILPTLPFFVVSIGFCMGTSWIEKHSVGAKGPDWDISFPQRCLIAGRVFWFYVGKLLWPAKLTFIYPRWRINASSLLQWLFPLTAVGALLTLWLARARIGRGPLTAALFFAGTLFPSLGFMDAYYMTYSFVCDHWTYLSSLGLIALAAALLTRLAAHLRAPSSLYALAPVVLGILAILTWGQCGIYADMQTLWLDTLAKNPDAWLAHNNLGMILRDQGRVPEAIAHYEASIRLDPNFVQAYNNLGVALQSLGRIQEATDQFDEALRRRPDFAEARDNLANVLHKQGKLTQAIDQDEEALRTRPNFAEAHYNLAIALNLEGKTGEAIEHYEKAIGLKPDFFEPRYNLGWILIRQGRIPEAVEQFTETVRIRPGSADAHNSLAVALMQQGNLDQAAAQWNEVLRLRPDYPKVNYNLGVAFENLGRTDDAIAHFQQEVRLDPDFFDTHFHLGIILLRLGRIQEAVGHFNEAVRIRPDSAEAHNDLAWLLATLAPADGGDPARAVTLAERACALTGNQAPGYLDTLATAYAAAGRFKDAIPAAEKAIDLARAAGQSQLVGQIQIRLQQYRDGRAASRPADTTSPHGP